MDFVLHKFEMDFVLHKFEMDFVLHKFENQTTTKNKLVIIPGGSTFLITFQKRTLYNDKLMVNSITHII